MRGQQEGRGGGGWRKFQGAGNKQGGIKGETGREYRGHRMHAIVTERWTKGWIGLASHCCEVGQHFQECNAAMHYVVAIAHNM